ncbi:MAG: GAF domain-containing protein [Bacteroidales bacterium]|nr:GAF domain-containing protein [Bacteroidales bacterium]
MNAKSLNFKTEFHRKLHEQEILLKVSQSIIGTLDYGKVLQVISDGMSELLNIESSAIYLLKEDNMLYLGATTPPLDPSMPDFLRRAALKDHPHILKTITTGRPLYLPDTKKETLSQSEKEVIEMRNLRSLLYLPFIQESHAIGVLILGTQSKSRRFQEDEIDLGQTVANQLSIGIQNALLHGELRVHKENLEELVKEKTRDLDQAITELQKLNQELGEKNEDIYAKNEELEATLKHLKETQTYLVEAEKMASLGILTAGVAHEINNPLNFITGATEGLEKYFEEQPHNDNGRLNFFLNSLQTGIERVSRIVEGLNQFSRDNENYNERCNLNKLIDSSLLMLNHQLKDRIRVNRELLKDEIVFPGNIGKLHQVMVNILTNAIQSIEGKGQIDIRTRIEDGYVVISISDSGKGICEADLNHITDPFFTTKEPGKGTGLGLSISYTIIQNHSGQLKFRSEVGTGTTAEIYLPYNQREYDTEN